MSDSGRLLVPFSSQAINVLSPQFGAKGDGVTDDTAAIQAAMNAANAKAATNRLADVWLPSGYGFKFGQLSVKSGVRLWCYGATLLPNAPGITNAWFWGGFGGQFNRFEIRGGSWQGAGTETLPMLQTGTAAFPNGPYYADFTAQDMYVTNWGGGGLYVDNPQRVRFVNNTFINCNANSNLNLINMVVNAETANPTQDLLVTGNLINSAVIDAAAIAYVNTVNGGTTDVRLIITNNVCIGAAGGANDLAGSIDIEFDSSGGGPWTNFLIANNIVEVAKTAGQLMYAVTVEAGTAKAQVIGNSITSSYHGILVSGTDIDVSHNRISATSPGLPISGTPTVQMGNRFSGGQMQGKATLVAGTVTVNTAEIVAGDTVFLSVVSPGGTRGEVQLGAIVAGTSFVINSVQPGTASALQTGDTSTVFWQIVH